MPDLNTWFQDPRSSVRLQAALAAGTAADPADLSVLLERCAVEPDFFVRDMLTWAITRLPPAQTMPAVVAELDRDLAQARSQALHTLSKIGDRRAFPMVSHLISDPVDEVYRPPGGPPSSSCPPTGEPSWANSCSVSWAGAARSCS